MYIFSKIGPPEVIACYLQDLEAQGVDISSFSLDWLPDQPPNFLKRKREPSQKIIQKKKTLKLGKSSAANKKLMLLTSSSTPSGKSSISEAPHPYVSRQLSSSLPLPPSHSRPQLQHHPLHLPHAL